MKKLLTCLAIVASVMSVSCGGPSSQSTGSATPTVSNKLFINGSTTLLPLAEKAVEAFRKRKPDITVSLSGGGSLAGINGLIDGYSDIAMSSRALHNDEKDKLRKKRLGSKEQIVALDAIIPIVHPTNPVKDLTLAQLKDIFTGKITDWQQVGGKKGEIQLFARDFTSGTHEAWSELVLNKEAASKSAREKASSTEILEMIALTPNAIGYDGIGYVEGDKRVKPLSVDGKVATATSVLDRSYKIIRPLYFFTRENPSTAVIEFMNFVLSGEGQALISQAKFVPIPH